MGDMGAHIFDAPIWALNLGMPTKIQATSSPYSTDYMPLCELVTYEFPARGDMPAVKVTWCDGGLRPPRPEGLEAGRAMKDATYYGEKGILLMAAMALCRSLFLKTKNFKVLMPGFRAQAIYSRTGLVQLRVGKNRATISHLIKTD